MRTLLLAGSLLLVALAPTASAHNVHCRYPAPAPVGGVVGQVYDFTTWTTFGACGTTVGIIDAACHFLVGNACPI